MLRQPDERAGGERGFTLLEILVGLLISSGIMVGLSLSMRAINSGWEASTLAIERQGTFATALGVVAGDFARILRKTDDPKKPQRFLFSGGPAETNYLLAERPVNAKEGMYWVRLSARRRNGLNELVRERAPYDRQVDTGLALKWRDTVILLRGPFDFGISYRAPAAGKTSWADNWPDLNVLPAEIRLTITDPATGRNIVPPLVQSLMLGAEADCVNLGAPGCTVRSKGVLASGSGN